MWKRFPEVLSLNNTYKTNRFKICLFQVTGITDQRSVANFAFGLIGNKRQEGYDWLCNQLDSFRQQLEIPMPDVVVTDKESALKNALERVFPDTQQQLCLYHINANIHAKIHTRWKKEEGEEDNDDDNEGPNKPADNKASANAPTPSAADKARPPVAAAAAADDNDAANEARPPVAAAAQQPREDPLKYSKEGLKRAWARVMYAEDKAGYRKAWKALTTLFEERQGAIVSYLLSVYIPLGDQFLQCRIKRYRNYSQRTNSPTKTAHKDVKSHLLTGTGDLLHLNEAIVQMLAKKEQDYKQIAARQEMQLRQRFVSRGWLRPLPTQVGYVAVNLLAKQYRLAESSVKGNTRLPPCGESCTFTQQYALPYAHFLKRVILSEAELTKEVIHPRWWLVKPLVCFPPNLYGKATNSTS